MKNLKRVVLSSTVAAGMLVATSAWAFNTTFFTIQKLEMGTSMDGAYRIYPLGGETQDDCGGNSDYYELATGSTVSSAEKEVINRTLLSAFLAGKKIALRLRTECSASGRPAYYQVALDRSQ